MKIDLKKYMEERDKMREQASRPGPVVTISRQYGCEANKIAIKLLGKIADMQQGSVVKSQWKYINKEAIDEAAKELHLPMVKLEHQITSKYKAVTDIFDSFSHLYDVSDKKIRDTLKTVLDTYVQKGKLIIIGRGGTQFVQKVKDAIRIRLFAPMDYRILKISESKNISKEEAKDLVKEVDRIRTEWSERITGIKYSENLFDILINRKTVPEEQIVDTIISLMKQKRFI